MKILFVILFSQYIFGKIVVTAKQDSEYAWTMDSNLENRRKDFYYNSLGDYDIYGSEVSDKLERPLYLRIGEFHKKKIGSKFHKADCERLGDDYYLDEYKPKLHIYDKSSGSVYEVDILSYFTYNDRQVWNCTTRPLIPLIDVGRKVVGAPTGEKSTNFYRIVSEMHGIRQISTIFYYDGIEVCGDNCPVGNSENIHNIKTVTFKEIKYVDPSTEELVYYKGNLNSHFVSDKSIFEELSDPEPKHEEYEELPFLKENYVYSKIIGKEKSGLTLRIGNDRYLGTYGNKDQEATCELDMDNKYLYEQEYLPQCLILDKDGEFNDEYGSPPKKLSYNYLSTIKQEIWKCKWGQDSTFTRRVTEMVAAIPVAKVEYKSGVEVWKYRLEGNSYSIKIREVYYHLTTNISYPIRFQGKVRIIPSGKNTLKKNRMEPLLYSTRNRDQIFKIPRKNYGSHDAYNDMQE